MKFQNSKISTRLIWSSVIILLLVSFLGFVAFWQTERLAHNTTKLYEHPLQVSKAALQLKSEVYHMQNLMQEVVLQRIESNDFLYQQTEKQMNASSLEFKRALRVMRERYLGDHRILDEIEQDYNHIMNDWAIILQNLDTGKFKEADLLFKQIQADRIKGLLAETQRVVEFAANKSDFFYRSAQNEQDTLRFWLLILFTATVIIVVIVVVYLYRAVKIPLDIIIAATQNYKDGNYEARSSYACRNEMGLLSHSFNKLADSIQAQMSVKEKAALISEALLKENDMSSFSQVLLKELVSKTKCQTAAFYLKIGESKIFGLSSSIGLSAESLQSFSAEEMEGEFGAVLAVKKMVRISSIPSDSCYQIKTSIGNFIPAEIITIPILDRGEVVAVISLSALAPFSDEAIRLLNEVRMIINARVNGVMLMQKLIDFSEKLDKQNHELSEKTGELEMQAEELREYNIELKMQKKQLDEANRLKSAFLSNMSHELRTPLNSVIALSGVLSRRLNGCIPDDQSEYIRVIEKNGKQLLKLINEILDLSRIEAGRESVDLSDVDIKELIGSIVDMTTPLLANSSVEIKTNLPDSLPAVNTDRSKCFHILQNIIANAVKFTENGWVEIAVETVGVESLVVRVKDTGIGISKENLPFIFDEFRQADDRTSRKYGGTGLGLAIAKKYARLLQSDLSVESEPGVGTTFSLTLPLSHSGLVPAAQKSGVVVPRHQSPVSIQGKTILIVEDSEPQIVQLTDILTEVGYKTLIARNGKEALAYVELLTPDAIIMDLMMPEIDGFETLNQLRSKPETRSLPVLILSAKHITPEERKSLNENHISQLIQKGDISRSELLAQVANLFSNQIDAPEKDKKSARIPRTSKGSILLIEDNPDNRMTVRALLDDKHLVWEASNGEDGLKMAQSHAPDVILLDISLPGKDGFEVLSDLKNQQATANTPVIALTARAMKGDEEMFYRLGFDDYISKPIDNVLFETKLNAWLYGE